MQYAPTLSQPQPQHVPQPVYEISDEDRSRQKRIAEAWQAYNGELDPPLQKTPEGIDPNVMSNRMAPIVDRGIDFLFGKELEISVEEGAPADAQTVLDKAWGQKEQRVPLLQELAMNGALAGEAFLRIVPTRSGQYRLVVVDPSIVFVQTAPQDCKTVLLYCIEYMTHEKRDGKSVQVCYREEIARVDPEYQDDTLEDALASLLDARVTWSIGHWSRIGTHGPWTPAGEPIAWNYAFPPLFACQNLPYANSFWGKPDITPDLIGMNKALNLDLSCINLIELIYGQPLLYATGTGEQVIDRKPGKVIGLPLSESKIVAVSIASDTTNALAFAADLRSDIDEQSSVPGVATGRIKDMPRGNLSGIAIELLFMPLLKKTEKKQMLYGRLLIDVSKALLVLNGMSGEIDITLAWQSPLPHDDLPAIQAAIALSEIGVSKTTRMRDLGYDPDAEFALGQTEGAEVLQALPPGIPGVPTLPGQKFPVPGQPAAPQAASAQQGGQVG